MGDKKGKKDRAKEHRQTEARHAKVARQKQDRLQPLTMGDTLMRGASNPHRGQK